VGAVGIGVWAKSGAAAKQLSRTPTSKGRSMVGGYLAKSNSVPMIVTGQ
jgi:hypothetical protein